jgi:uncharacterized protein (TIGR02145 family)
MNVESNSIWTASSLTALGEQPRDRTYPRPCSDSVVPPSAAAPRTHANGSSRKLAARSRPGPVGLRRVAFADGLSWPLPRRIVQKVLQNIVAIASTIAFASAAGGCVTHRAPGEAKASGALPPSQQMPDGKRWTIRNLNVATDGSYCYEDSDANCRRYGRLYMWRPAERACRSLGAGWRLPTNDDWQRMAKHYGGVRGDAKDAGKAAFTALSSGGRSGFNALLGGVRGSGGEYARLDAHGFFWTASETDSGHAWFYNFGRGGQALNRHEDGDKRMAISVRCVQE